MNHLAFTSGLHTRLARGNTVEYALDQSYKIDRRGNYIR